MSRVVDYVTILGLLACGASAQPLEFFVNFDGNINGEQLQAEGSGSLDRDGLGVNEASIEFEAIPGGFQPLAVDTLLTNICPNGFIAQDGTQNLWDLGTGNYSLERTFQWVGLPNSLITVDAEVAWTQGKPLVSTMTLEGTYDGPTDLVEVESYNVLWLPGSADGEVFEAGTAVVRRATGEALIVQFASRYTGLTSNLAGVQTGTGVFETSFDGQTLAVDWEGTFRVPAPGVLAIGGLASLIATRRRR